MKITVQGVETDETDEFDAPMLVWAPDSDGDLHVYEGSVTAVDAGHLMEVATFARGQWRLVLVRQHPEGDGNKAVWRRAQRRLAKQFEK